MQKLLAQLIVTGQSICQHIWVWGGILAAFCVLTLWFKPDFLRD